MTAASLKPTPATGRGLAFLVYFLLLAAIPTGGFSALLGLILAYSGRDGAAPVVRSHYRFQIRIFWIGLTLLVAAFALGLAAWMGWFHHAARPVPYIPRSPDAQTIAFHPDGYNAAPRPAAFHSWSYQSGSDLAALPLRARLEGYAALASFAASGLWSLLAPLWGLVRLASGRPMGHSASD